MSLSRFFSGKKTYSIAFLLMVLAVASFVTGGSNIFELARDLLYAAVFATIRAGISFEALKALATKPTA